MLQTKTHDLSLALAGARAQWEQLRAETPEDTRTKIGLPRPFIVPSRTAHGGFVYDEMYYWDNLFIIYGLLADGDIATAEGIVENEVSLLRRFGLVPNASRFYMLSRSQPPTLTLQLGLVYEAGGNTEWYLRNMELAEAEYREVWASDMHPHNRMVHEGLSRYYDINVLHSMAEAESGWDFTPRFQDRCLDFLPVDLNALLWRYEHDFAVAAEMRGDGSASREWRERAEERKAAMMRLMWDDVRGFFFDYDYKNLCRSPIYSLAAYVPLYVGMLDEGYADRLVEHLDSFETPFGLATTPPGDGSYEGRQWASPNGWAPLHLFVVEGLERSGRRERAASVAAKWLRTNALLFERTGEFHEKYNVVNPDLPPLDGVYPSQTGFGWTVGTFIHLASRYA